MKVFNRNRSIIITFFFLFGLSAVPALAGGYTLRLGHHNNHNNGHANHGHHSSHQHHYRYSFNYGYGNHSNYGYNYSYGNSYNYRQPDYYYQPRRHNNYNNMSSYSKPCHHVSKTVVDDYGEYHRIGGTMCYDHHGQGYVVKGSRYRIR